MNYIYWHIRKDNHNILWAGLDCPASSVNTLNKEVLTELEHILDQTFQGIVFYSLKQSSFIVGADIKAFSTYSELEIEQFIQLGQAVFNKLANLSAPSIALVDGYCLGGGFELALACQYRIITENSIVGLPEVQLGIFPAWGGIHRSIDLIGTFHALTSLLLAGKNINAKKALSLGLVSNVLPRRQLEAAAIHVITAYSKPRQCNFLYSSIYCRISSFFITKIVRFFLKRRVNQVHYPAPYVILDLVEMMYSSKKIDSSVKGINNVEVNAIKKLIVLGGTARQLIRVFQLKEHLKHFFPQSRTHSDTLKKFHTVHIAGAGTMGVDIAALFALKGFYVTLSDISFDALGKALIRARKYFEKECKEKHAFESVCDRFTLDFENKGIEKADIILEAIVENLAVKQSFFEQIEKKAKPSALFITNTSSLCIKDIVAKMKEKHRLAGVHFFNPATKMPLVEIIYSYREYELFSEILAFITQVGKLPIPVSDSPGFLVNRILAPYLVKGLNFASKGIKPSVIDGAAQAFGMLMGPMELADTIGLDVCLTVAQNLFEDSSITLLRQKVEAGDLGKKTGRGFFRYNKFGKKILSWLPEMTSQDYTENKRNSSAKSIDDELIEAILNEAKCCLDAKIVDEKDLIDAAMIFGAGFAPFRGGPLEYAEQLSLKNSVNRE